MTKKHASRNHPANNGQVMLTIWIDAPLRDYVRARAQESGVPVSKWASEALRRELLSTSFGALRFPLIADQPAPTGATSVRKGTSDERGH